MISENLLAESCAYPRLRRAGCGVSVLRLPRPLMKLYLRSARSCTLDILPFDWQDIRSRRCRLEVFFQRRPGRIGSFLERSNPPHMLVDFYR